MRFSRKMFMLAVLLWVGHPAYPQLLPDSVGNALKPLQGADRLKAMPGCMMALYQHTPPYLEKVLELGNKGIKLAKQLDDKKKQAIINLHMARGYYHAGIYDKRPQDYLKTAITLCEQTGNTNGAGVCNMYLGDVYKGAKEYHEAIIYFQKATELLNKDAQYELKKTYSNLGACYMQLDDCKNALDCYTKAMPYVPIDDLETQAQICNNMGAIYQTLKNYDLALQHYQKCLEIATQLNDKKWMAFAYNNIANVYQAKRLNNEALEYYKKSLKIKQTIGDKNSEAKTLKNIGIVYEQKGEYNTALQYYEKALKIFTKLGNAKKITAVLNNIASVIAAMENPGEAIALLDSIIVYAEKQNDPINLKTIYLNLSELYEAGGNAGKALKYARGYESVLSELYDIDINKLAALQRAYKLLEKEKELEIARRDSRFKTTIILALSGVFIMLSIVALLANIAYRHKTLRKLAETESELARKESEMAKTESELAETKGKLFRSLMKPHFLFNALGAIQSKILKGDAVLADEYLVLLSRLLRQVLNVSDEEYIPLEQEIEILDRFCQMQQIRFIDRFDYIIEVSPDIEPGSVAIPPLLTHPAVENSTEHGMCRIPRKGLLKIGFSIENNMLVCKVDDNGIGINRHIAAKEDDDSEYEEDKSFGLKIMEERLALISKQTGKEATIEIIDKETIDKKTKGTLVIIKIPLKELF